MQYVGIHTQQARNNFRSMLLLCLFPVLVLVLVYAGCYILFELGNTSQTYNPDGSTSYSQLPAAYTDTWSVVNSMFIAAAPYAVGGVLLWFIIAYFANTAVIKSATSSHTLSRMENKRVYNLVENLCMSVGMQMPKLQIIEDDSLNAFASGINNRTFTITLSRGIINKLDDAELEGVIAHELTHIRNKDVRLLIVSIVFVGIFSMIAQIGFQILRQPRRRRGKNEGGIIMIILLIVVLAAVGYFFSTLMRFAISRKREYMADAGAAELTKNPVALASALRKISADPNIEAVTRSDVAQLFIEHPGRQAKSFLSGVSNLFATHPPIQDRIKVLEQF